MYKPFTYKVLNYIFASRNDAEQYAAMLRKETGRTVEITITNRQANAELV